VRRLVAGCLLGATLTACGVAEEATPRFREPTDIPFGLDERPATTTPQPAVGPTPSISCFVEDDGIVVRSGAPGAPLLARLRAGPGPADNALTTALPDPGIVTSAAVRGGVAEIDLRSDFAELPGTQQRMIAAQLVCTATATPGVGQVRFTLGGSPLSVPRGDGSLTEERLTLDDYAEQLHIGS
jgi:hypothetical protein